MFTRAPDGSSSAKLAWLTPGEVRDEWPEIMQRMRDEPRIWRYYSPQGLVREILDARLQVWRGDDLCIFTRVDTYQSGLKTLRVTWAYGSGFDRHFEEIVDTFRRFAQAQGCADVEISGREGWKRKLRRLVGAREVVSTLVIPVEHSWRN